MTENQTHKKTARGKVAGGAKAILQTRTFEEIAFAGLILCAKAKNMQKNQTFRKKDKKRLAFFSPL